MHFADRLGIDAANISSYGTQLKEPQIQNVKKVLTGEMKTPQM